MACFFSYLIYVIRNSEDVASSYPKRYIFHPSFNHSVPFMINPLLLLLTFLHLFFSGGARPSRGLVASQQVRPACSCSCNRRKQGHGCHDTGRVNANLHGTYLKLINSLLGLKIQKVHFRFKLKY